MTQEDPRFNMEIAIQGGLFAGDFLCDGITDEKEWNEFDDSALDALEIALKEIFNRFLSTHSPNESQTEKELIWPILEHLGWKAHLPQQNLSARGRQDVPDGLMFENEEEKAKANRIPEGSERYEFGIAIVESKRWMRALDRRTDKEETEPSPQMPLDFDHDPNRSKKRPVLETAPSTQMLRYLRRVDDLTTGKLRWGILTNGATWRLYFAGARSVSEQFFEVDLPRVLNLPGNNDDPFAIPEDGRRHCLKVFALMFRREAFLPLSAESRTFHQLAMDQGRRYEERITGNIFEQIFKPIFPELVAAIAAAAPDAPLPEVREAALIILYRLLFILYAEDRNLLPVRDSRYDDYSLRKKVRDDVGHRKNLRDTFSTSADLYWSAFNNLCRAIDAGDASIGLPPYNGGLFDPERTPLLGRIWLSDQIMANVIDTLSFEMLGGVRRYVNYRDLGVQQLGSIYERLLEQEVVRVGNDIEVRLSPFARKGSGSYYTPDDLVGLIIEEAVGPLVQARTDAFIAEVSDSTADRPPEADRVEELKQVDPAEKILELKICDPAMGSGHFLVNLVDYLADRVIAAMAEAEAAVAGYVSPLTERVEEIRETIKRNAQRGGWRVDEAQLDDRHVVRRMVLKRCIYGVDKNPMAVELAKVALWLHTFTVGAPLSFLDHHLSCGDSLFGSWVSAGVTKAKELGNPLFLYDPIRRATDAAIPMQEVERLTDTEIAEAQESAEHFTELKKGTKPLASVLSLVYAIDWLKPWDEEDKRVLHDFFNHSFGDPVNIAQGKAPKKKRGVRRLAALLEKTHNLIGEEHFLHWQVAFPGVWSEWENAELKGGFDAVIGNPPWDRVKLQQVEWFAARRPEIARATRAADRKRMIAELEKAEDPLAHEFAEASERAKTAALVARNCGDYPLLSGGDVNLYSLFVERAMSLVKPDGMVGLLTPSGIASDKTAAKFFKGVATEGRLKALYDFENRRTRHNTPPFFPDVDSRFKFCAFVAGPSPMYAPAQCAFFLQSISELKDPERRFSMSEKDFADVNPNTGTAPIFRTEKDSELTKAIYSRLPVLVNRSSEKEIKAWPGKHATMFHMSNDSHLFRTRTELEEKEAAWPIEGNRFANKDGEWLPLYEGKMVQAFDHRAASVSVNPDNLHRPNQPEPSGLQQQQNPNWLPHPRYWILDPYPQPYIGWKMVTAPTNSRTFIAAFLPPSGSGHSIDVILPDNHDENDFKRFAPLILGNFNSLVFDFVIRQKIQGQNISWYIIEQLPVVPPKTFETTSFGPKTAGEIVRDAVLELTYTAHDMAPFARDMDYVDEKDEVLQPFAWDETRRLHLRAKLDAVFFHLYGVTDRDDVRYIYSTFPIVEREDTNTYGDYRSRDLCLAYMNALAAGEPDAKINL
ncbi:MAG: restriction endonuclease [Nitrospinae bacterium]|nr:restriction endonuclease [Nitrospinota bacterium]